MIRERAVVVDGSFGPSLESFLQEVGHGVLHRVTRVRGDARLQVGDGLAELVLDLRLGLALALDATALAFRVHAKVNGSGVAVPLRIDRGVVLADHDLGHRLPPFCLPGGWRPGWRALARVRGVPPRSWWPGLAIVHRWASSLSCRARYSSTAFLMTQDTSRSWLSAYLASRALNSAATRTGGSVVSRIGSDRPLLLADMSATREGARHGRAAIASLLSWQAANVLRPSLQGHTY